MCSVPHDVEATPLSAVPSGAAGDSAGWQKPARRGGRASCVSLASPLRLNLSIHGSGRETIIYCPVENSSTGARNDHTVTGGGRTVLQVAASTVLQVEGVEIDLDRHGHHDGPHGPPFTICQWRYIGRRVWLGRLCKRAYAAGGTKATIARRRSHPAPPSATTCPSPGGKPGSVERHWSPAGAVVAGPFLALDSSVAIQMQFPEARTCT
jgi:hypothetical protein